MRTMAVIAGVLLALLLLTGWLLKGAWEDLSTARTELERAQAAARAFESRFDSLDKAVVALSDSTRRNNDRLAAQLHAIQNITKTEDDTDETIACLDLPVARQLDQRLRHQPTGR